MKIILKTGKNIKEEIVDDDYFNLTVNGLKCATEDISKLIESNLPFYMNKYVIREAMELYGNTDICVEKLRDKLITLMLYKRFKTRK